MDEKSYQVGHLLRSSIAEFVVGSPIVDRETPKFGSLVKAPLGQGDQIFGVVYDIQILDDGLVRQLVTGEQLDPTVIADNRTNRTVPMEISVLSVGYQRSDGQPSHLLPPRAPLSLDVIYECSPVEIRDFTGMGWGYLRHLLRNPDLPTSELIAAHVQQAAAVHRDAGNEGWAEMATQELITLLRDDYPSLMQVLGAIADGLPEMEVQS